MWTYVCGHVHVLTAVLYVHVRARVCMHVCVCVVGGCVESEAVKSCKSHGHTRCSQVKSCESAGVSARDGQWRAGGSVVAVGVDREDRIVAVKVGCAQRVPWSEGCEECVT